MASLFLDVGEGHPAEGTRGRRSNRKFLRRICRWFDRRLGIILGGDGLALPFRGESRENFLGEIVN